MSGKKLGSVVVVALGIVAAASASPLSRPEVISVLTVPGESTSIPPLSENAPPPVGARAFFRNSLYKWAGTKRGERVGRLEGTCTFTGQPDKRSVAAYCTEGAFLPAGQILVAGFIRFTEKGVFNLAVIGGTGRYTNARGSLRIKDIPNGNSALVFRLVA